MYGIKGALAYNTCKRNCARLRDRVGVKALDGYDDPRHPRAAPALVPVPARAQRLLRRSRAPRSSAGATSGRSPRTSSPTEPYPPRPLAARRRGRPGQVARLAQRGPRSDREREVADHHERDDCGRKRSRQVASTRSPPRCSAARHSALQEQARLLREPAARLVLRRLQPQEGHGRESAPSDGAGDRPSRDRRPRQPSGEPAEASRRRESRASTPIDPHSRYLPAHGNLAAAKALMAKVAHPLTEVTLYYPNAPGAEGPRRHDPGDVAAARDPRHAATAGVQAVPPVPRAPAEQRRRHVPAQLGVRLPRRDERIRAVHLRVGKQQHQPLQHALRHHVARARPVQDADLRYRLYGGIEQAMFGRTATCRSFRSTGARTWPSSARAYEAPSRSTRRRTSTSTRSG